MSGDVCMRGCMIRGEHFASCPSYGAIDSACRGCVPRATAPGVLVCDACKRRAKWLARELPVLLDRLRGLRDDPLHATVFDRVRVAARRGDSSAPVAADLLDALDALERVQASWFRWSLSLDELLSDRESVLWVSEAILDRHPSEDGIREAWSVQDAVDKWGERRAEDSAADERPEDGVLSTAPIPEWDDPLLAAKEAAERAGVSDRALRRWVVSGVLEPVAQTRDARGKLTRWFRGAAVDAAKAEMAERAARSRFGGING